MYVLNLQAFDIVSMEEIAKDYIWKATTALISIYVFFISERFLKFFLKAREVRYHLFVWTIFNLAVLGVNKVKYLHCVPLFLLPPNKKT